MRHLTKPRSRKLIALICALILLGAQQAAFAHWLGHLGIAAEISAASGTPGKSETQGKKEGHGSTASLSHACTTCLAYTALAAAAPLPAHLAVVPPAWTATAGRTESLPAYSSRRHSYAARAPPVPL